MSVSSGEQRRGSLDKYTHAHESVINNPEVWFDEGNKCFVSQSEVPNMVACQPMTAELYDSNKPDDYHRDEPQQGDQQGGDALWIPQYRETNGAQQPVHNQPLAVKPTPWQDPWARDPREVRATEDQLAQAAAAIAKS